LFPFESLTEVTLEVASFQPTITTFKFPAVCAAAKVTGTVVFVVCGVAE
jgi:hypothetical protein